MRAEAGQAFGVTIVGWVLIILGVALFVVGLSGVFFWGGRGKDVDQYIPAKPLTDEDIAMAQFAFERRLEGDSDRPGAVVWGDAYIYWQLMSKWFRTLLEKHRNNDKLAAKLRSDWLDYLHCLVGEAEQSWRSKVAIEDAFAAVIGDEATQFLRRIRAAKHNAFCVALCGRDSQSTNGWRAPSSTGQSRRRGNKDGSPQLSFSAL